MATRETLAHLFETSKTCFLLGLRRSCVYRRLRPLQLAANHLPVLKAFFTLPCFPAQGLHQRRLTWDRFESETWNVAFVDDWWTQDLIRCWYFPMYFPRYFACRFPSEWHGRGSKGTISVTSPPSLTQSSSVCSENTLSADEVLLEKFQWHCSDRDNMVAGSAVQSHSILRGSEHVYVHILQKRSGFCGNLPVSTGVGNSVPDMMRTIFQL